jgi:Exocyst complex component Sec3
MFSTVTSKLTKLCNLIVAEIDGMEILGILAVLQQYVTDHLLSKQQMLQTQQQEQEQLLQPQHAGILTTTTTTTTAAAPTSTSTSTTAIQAQNTKADTVKPDHSSLYLITMLHELRFSLLSKLKSYIGDQVAWILAQKSDPKKAGVTVPVAKFPSFVRQVLEMTGGQVRYSVFRTTFYFGVHRFLFIGQLLFSPSYFSYAFHC